MKETLRRPEKRQLPKRISRPPTPESLNAVAERYLARFAASEAGVRRVLNNRLRRVSMLNPDFAANHFLQEQLQSEIETIIEKYRRIGVLNDAAYADMKRNSMRRQGRSRNAIKNKLHVKGIGKEIIATTMTKEIEAADETGVDQEIIAAMKWAKRKKFGSFAPPLKDVESQRARHQKHIASMARAGFSFDVIKKILQSSGDVDDLIDNNF